MPTVLVPSGLTLDDLKSRIAREIHRSDLDTDIAVAVNRSIKFYQGRRFAFNQLRTTFSTTAGTEFYTTDTAAPSTLPSDIGEIDLLTVTTSGTRWKLDEKSEAWIEAESQTTTSQSCPMCYSFYAGRLRLYPIPDQTYTLTISYLQKVDADAGSSVWTNEAEDLICHAAKKRLYRDVLRDTEAAQLSAQAEVDEFKRLMKDARQLNTGSLRGSGL